VLAASDAGKKAAASYRAAAVRAVVPAIK